MDSKQFNITASESPKAMASNIRALKHHIGVKTSGTVGALKIQAKAPGSAVFEDIPNATAIDLAAPISVQVEGAIAEFLFTINGATATDVITTTVSFEVND
jgi:hypothetical protein